MDLEVLPPCIWEGGKGEAATGLPPHMEGGIIPDHVQPDLPSPSVKSYQTFGSFEGTEQMSLASVGEECDTLSSV